MKSEKKLNRRKFLGTTVAGTMGVAMAASPVKASERKATLPIPPDGKNPFNPRTFGAMPTNALGKTGYKVGIFSLGGQAAIETQGMEDVSEKIINRALDLGVNYIDTGAGNHHQDTHDQVQKAVLVDWIKSFLTGADEGDQADYDNDSWWRGENYRGSGQRIGNNPFNYCHRLSENVSI